jgi:hypothetical protein
LNFGSEKLKLSKTLLDPKSLLFTRLLDLGISKKNLQTKKPVFGRLSD